MPNVFVQDFPTKQSALFIACPCFNTTSHSHRYLSHCLVMDMSREIRMLSYLPLYPQEDRDYHHLAEEEDPLNSTMHPDSLIL